jgi:RNA polymerase sigma-70 factor (ECF subfamily)
MGSVVPDDELRHLAEAAAHGDDVALGELVRRTQPVVWRTCTLLGSAGEEEDLVQETYLRAMRSLRTFRGDAPVRAWLVAVARNVCADHVRRRQRANRLLQRLHVEPVVDRVSDPHGEMDDLLAALDPDRREAFVVTQVLGLSYAEAAVALDCPVGTIRSRVSRARADLIAAVRQAEAQ